jgi:hypothetical protein
MVKGCCARHGLGKGKRGTGQLAKVIECAQARYEVQDVEFGKVYKWRPKHVLVECRCGQRLSLTASRTSCLECGTDHELAVIEASAEDGHQSDKTSTPDATTTTLRIANKRAACLSEMRHQTILGSREAS